MKIAILNWSGGENDPFTAFSHTLKQEFEACGRDVVIVPFEGPLQKTLEAAHRKGLDFALTWQGIGVQVRTAAGTSPWDEQKLPLLCLHGDHPCQNPPNHAAGSHWIRHFYSAASFSRYANQHFPRREPGLLYKVPMLYPAEPPSQPGGDHFVLAKNLDDTEVVLEGWRKQLPPVLLQLHLDCADAIRTELRIRPAVDQHAVVDAVLERHRFFETIAPRISNLDPLAYYHRVHDRLNKFYRNALSEWVLEELADVPIHVYGRGWDRIAARGNPRHRFAPGLPATASGVLFHSRWGILDVAPSCDSIHDRTLRAIGCGTGFLAATSWPFANLMGEDADRLLFNATPGHLQERAQRVIDDPERHRAASRAFGAHYRRWATHFELLRTLELTAAVVRAGP